MKIVVFGATGGTGTNVVERALAAGHHVVAVARRPEAVKPAERLSVHKGDVFDAASIAGAFPGADAAISCIGPANMKEPGTILSVGLPNIIAGCRGGGVKRLVFESGIMMSEGEELSVLSRMALAPVHVIFRKAIADKRLAEQAVLSSELDWVIVRAPTLTHTPARGAYQAGPKLRINVAASLPHPDVADCLIRATQEPGWVRKIVNVGR
jgi:uncharacterized protein YbjT (DUF2867 family)